MYAGGLGATAVDETRDTFLVQQMHALALAIGQAKARGDKVDAAALLVRFNALAAEYRARGASDMTAYDRFVLEVGKYLEGVLDAIPKAIAELPKDIGKGLLEAAIPFALIALGYILLKREAKK